MTTPDPYDDPPTPPWWEGIAALALLLAILFLFVAICTGCTCTLDGEAVARAIIIYRSEK